MNGSKPTVTISCDNSGGESSDSRKQQPSIPSTGGSNYAYSDVSGYVPSYRHVYYPGSYTHQQYPSAIYHYHPTYPAHHNYSDYHPTSDTTIPPPHNNNHYRNWNPTNPPSPLKPSTAPDTSILKPRAKESTKSVSHSKLTSPPSTPSTSEEYIDPNSDTLVLKPRAKDSPQSESRSESSSSPSPPPRSEEYIDPKILEAANALKLPLGGQKYSVTRWKDAMRLCYRWKTTTNEHERQVYRTSTTANSISSTNLKSIKFFCEKILKRKSKRRQFSIHWKESGLKKIVDEALSSEDSFFGLNDTKLESTLDDYFSGRTRSSGYNLARERVLDDRQKEIVALWDALMAGPILSDASSHQKLFLIQLAIERPYRNKKVEIKTKDQKIIHDVAIEGYGGESYWDKNNASKKTDGKTDTLHDPTTPKSFDGVLPVNENMVERFWKCANSLGAPERQGKRRRPSFPLSVSDHNTERGDESGLEEFTPTTCMVSEKRRNTGEKIKYQEDKENETNSFVPV